MGGQRIRAEMGTMEYKTLELIKDMIKKLEGFSGNQIKLIQHIAETSWNSASKIKDFEMRKKIEELNTIINTLTSQKDGNRHIKSGGKEQS